MKLGIIGAMQVEVEALAESMTQRTAMEKCGCTFYAGRLNGVEAVVVQCGVGKVNAALCVQVLCDLFQVTHIINTGVAGSLDPRLDIGDLVISRDAMYHDFNCSGLNYPMGQVPGMDVLAFPAARELMDAALAAAEAVNPGHASVGRVASGDQFIAEKQRKEQIIALTGASCTEMEGAAIAQAAWRNAVPFVILRAISDKADDSAEMDYPTFERIAAHRCAQVVASMTALL